MAFDPLNPPVPPVPSNMLTRSNIVGDYLFGIPLEKFATTCEAIPEAVYNRSLRAAYAWMETELGIDIIPKLYIDETHDYRRDDYTAWCYINLYHAPALAFYQLRGVFPTSNPNDGITFPDEWIRLTKINSTLQLVPSSGTIANFIVGQSGAFLPLIYSGAFDFLPQFFHTVYMTGMNPIPEDINDIVGKRAANEIFKIISSLLFPIGMGNISLGVDGVSQSIGLTRGAGMLLLADRINQYEKDIQSALLNLRNRYYGYRMSVG